MHKFQFHGRILSNATAKVLLRLRLHRQNELGLGGALLLVLILELLFSLLPICGEFKSLQRLFVLRHKTIYGLERVLGTSQSPVRNRANLMAVLPRLSVALPLRLAGVQGQLPVATLASFIVASGRVLEEEAQREIVPDGALPVGAARPVVHKVVLDPIVHLLQCHSSVLHQTDAYQVGVVEWRLLIAIVFVEEVVALVLLLPSAR